MQVSVDWLREYVTVADTPESLAAKLTNVGLVVEVIRSLNPGVRGVVVGQVEAIERVAGSETLWVAQVDVGTGERLQVVTGAQNVQAGDRVPVAVPGSAIAGGQEVGVAEFRGLRSQGMLCAEDELGVGDDHDGIMILPPVAPIGADVADLLGLGDTVLELDLTTNYATHAQAMIGVALEYGALTGRPARWPEVQAAACEDPALGRCADQITVRIDAPDLCPRYAGRIIRGVRVGPSPLWLQNRVRAAGMRPINNIVDITNFVMLELGQPLHAFDCDQIGGRQIVVRRAKNGEAMRTLDGQDRVMDEEVLVIADAAQPMVIAGVMGGEDSEVTGATTNVFLEAAWFNNINNRRSSRRYNLPSEASARFTKGVDPSGTLRAMDRAAELMCRLAGGRLVPGCIDEYPRPYAPRVVPLRMRRLRTLIGLPIDAATARRYLERLGFAVLPGADVLIDAAALAEGLPTDLAAQRRRADLPVWQAAHAVSPVPELAPGYAGWAADAREQVLAAAESVGRWMAAGEDEVLLAVVPTRRLDVAIEDDLVEEVCRQHGYDKVESTLPQGPAVRGSRPRHQEVMLRARRLLAGVGLDEVVTYSLTSPRIYDKLRIPDGNPHRQAFTVQNPLLEERSTLRTLMAASMLDVLQYNVTRSVRDLSIFEIGKVYHKVAGDMLANEEWRLGIAGLGRVAAKGWNVPEREVDFFWLKGVIEHLLDRLGITEWTLGRTACPYLHPGRHAGLAAGGQLVGVFGEVHPEVQAAWDLPGRVYLAELEFMPLVRSSLDVRAYVPAPRFPAAVRDVALVVGQEVPALQLQRAIETAGGELVEEVRLFDLYQSAPVPEGKRSLAYTVTYRAPDRTLTDEEVSAAHGRVRQALAGLGADLRS